MKSTSASLLPLIGAAAAAATPKHQQPWERSVKLMTDINQISQHWGQIAPYTDNADDYFGVESVGLPDGCQVCPRRDCANPASMRLY